MDFDKTKDELLARLRLLRRGRTEDTEPASVAEAIDCLISSVEFVLKNYDPKSPLGDAIV